MPGDLVVVANRLPVDLVTDEQGREQWRTSPGGLVSALAPILQARCGTWVGWPGVPDVEPEPFDEDGMTLHPVPLSTDEVAAHYEGFANATLWPLYHDVVVRPVFDREWWETHRAVNERFADATAAVADEGATVWVQDYQLQLVPAMLRERRPDLRIGFFLHIPFPPVELFTQLPWRREVVEGLLGADLLGFQTPSSAENFRRLAARLLGRKVPDRQVGAFPISVPSAELEARAGEDGVRERVAELRRDLGDPTTLLLGVDRLDYTKGIDVRLAALGALFDAGDLDPADTVLVQLATPSRERVTAYQDTREAIERSVGRINGDHGRAGHPVVHYLHQAADPAELAAFYGAADVMVVTPVRDGMNLVAKEYVAARTVDSGALVLSEFSGAAEELTDAHLVNPHDVDGVGRALLDAVRETREGTDAARMSVLRTQVRGHDVDRWAQGFLDVLNAVDVQGAG